MLKSLKNATIQPMKERGTIILDGNSLTIEDIYRLVKDKTVKVKVSDHALKAVLRSRKFVDKEMNSKVIYGINTGFGPMASHVIGNTQLLDLQSNLIRSHAAGAGAPINDEFVLASMVVRLNTLIKGYSGVSDELVERLQKFINKRIIPVVPEHGAVGTSGDLVQLAHIALALMGEGEVMYLEKRQDTSAVLKKLRIRPYQLKTKEGLALINGTATMAGIAAILCMNANRILSLAVRNGALSLELVHGLSDSLSEVLHQLRPHNGQVVVAETMRNIVDSSKLLRERGELQKRVKLEGDVYEILEEVQQVYSLRCIPQILGPVYDTYNRTKECVEVEINSVTDNPIVDTNGKIFLHGGNFHGDYIATAVDQLKASFVKLTLLSERRINFFLNDKLNKILPPFINLSKPGLTLALQGIQFVATSTAAQNQTLAFPHSIHSIPTNADNQDIVSMGTDAALFANKVLENASIVLAIELITLSQAVDHLGVKNKLSKSSQEIFGKIRRIMPKIQDDRSLSTELEKIIKYIKKDDQIIIDWPDTI